MEKFAVDYQSLQGKLTKEKIYRWDAVKDKPHIKVAFDVVRFTDTNDNIDGLWQIKHSDDGDFIVAMYDDQPDSTDKKSSWDVVLDKRGENLNVFYKNTPIKKVAVSSLNIPKEDVNFVCSYLPNSLETNKKLANSLLSELPLDNKIALRSIYPELNDVIKIAYTEKIIFKHGFISLDKVGFNNFIIEASGLGLRRDVHFLIKQYKSNEYQISFNPDSSIIIDKNNKEALMRFLSKYNILLSENYVIRGS